MKQIVLLFCLMALYLTATGQTPPGQTPPVQRSTDSIPDQSAEENKRLFASIFAEAPGRAAFLSLLIPGGGQAYNKSYWKIPVVYAALGGMVFLIRTNKLEYDCYQNALKQRSVGVPDKFLTEISSISDLRIQRDYYDKNLQLSYIGFGIVYILAAAEAFVDGHLKTFDVSKNLSMQLAPKMIPNFAQQPAIGLTATFSLNGNSRRR